MGISLPDLAMPSTRITVSQTSREFFRGYAFQSTEHCRLNWEDWCGGAPLDNQVADCWRPQ